MAQRDGILNDPQGEIAKLKEMGITEHAILTYIVRVGDGHPREKALEALIAGRNLSNSQIDLVRSALQHIPTDRDTLGGPSTSTSE
jgi:hypothetical protein